MEKLISYRHIPLLDADRIHKRALKQKYSVTTINWTIAHEEDAQAITPTHVHQNEYVMTLKDLIKFIRRDTVAEDVYSIFPIQEGD